MSQRPRPLHPGDSFEALVGARIREYRNQLGISQRALGKLVHVSGDLIARIEKAERRASPKLLAEIDVALHARGEIAGYAPADDNATRHAATVRAAAATRESDDAVKRREFLGGAIGIGLAADIWDRLQLAVDSPGGSTGSILDSLQERTAWLFRAQDRMPSSEMSDLVRAHLDHLIGALATGQQRRPLLVMAGQTAALAGWMAFDTGDHGAARHYYATALSTAREAGHPPLAALALVYASYGESDPARALTLLDAAAAHVATGGSPRFRAWVAARRAEELARAGDAVPALAAVRAARLEYARDCAAEQPVWLEFLSSARIESMVVGAYTALRHPDALRTAVAAQEAIVGADSKVRAVILGDVATAFFGAGDMAETARIAYLALAETISGQASLGRQRLSTLASRMRLGGPEGRALAGELVAALA